MKAPEKVRAPKIESYRFGHIVIDGRAYTKDVIILPDRVIAGWRRESGHKLRPDDLSSVLDIAPDVLVVGQGAYGRMEVKAKTKRALANAGIELIAENTDRAVETYNALREQRHVAAAMHLTC